ncbi:MAG: uroporphyrinogen-III C-methyltransferase [Xanthomonadales bacterium]|nr:uroporphyrinogen-III C-methyltransferase [Xanthomonadales bacterium]
MSEDKSPDKAEKLPEKATVKPTVESAENTGKNKPASRQKPVAKSTASAVDKTENKKPSARQASKPPKSPSSGRGIAILALLLAVIAIGGGYWREFQNQEVNSTALAQASNENERLQAEIEGLQVAVESMGGKILGEDVLQPKLDKLGARIEAVSSSQLQQIDAESALQSRLSALEQVFSGLEDRQQITEVTLSGLALNKQATDRDVALAEVTFLIRVAAQRLVIFNDQAAAVEMLQLADQQLASQDSLLFAPVRHRIQEDLLAVNALQAPDIVAITGQLLALEQSVSLWQTHLPERSEEVPGESADGESNLRAKLAYLLGSLVTIREDQGNNEFLTLTQAERMKDRIRLELQAARVAALVGQVANYQSSINRVSNWLREYFDPSVSANASALNSLEELSRVELSPEWPDLNPLLVLTRQLQARPVKTAIEPVLQVQPETETES